MTGHTGIGQFNKKIDKKVCKVLSMALQLYATDEVQRHKEGDKKRFLLECL